MVQLPVWELGLIILIPLAMAFGGHAFLQRKWVDAAPPMDQPTFQFRLELTLFTASGLLSALILLFGYRYPLFESGLKLVLGIFTVGLFAGLDMALKRERMIIQKAQAGQATYLLPKETTPLTRKFSVLASLILLLITSIILLVIIRDVNWLAEQAPDFAAIDMLGRSVLTEILFVMGFLLVMVMNLIFAYTKNLRILFDIQTRILENVSRGDLSRRVPVTTSDEMGVIAGHTNIMISTLREGMRMREGLLIAQEVQQHFLPRHPPEMPGLDIAGTSLFSDETGGDFYDFIQCEADSCGQLAIAVGDVSGHGIGAALLMTAGRAVIRQNAATPGSATENIRRANKHLTRDIGDTGRFMTLFFMVVDPVNVQATWVNAGHLPPQFYDPETDRFSELKGEDIPLGVEAEWHYHEQIMDLPGPGQILLISTDGLWEEHNPNGEMFGRDRIRAILRNHAKESAQDILKSLCDAVREFSGSGRREDDLTIVVVKGVER
ncbi:MULTISPECIES: SpoIIE family protein phosphatase [unclassified Pseudodesulfovibrio]|uniref:PP2C family protein-serine/threonine phosphatase n=1 Tax=unclassified Pseudodesulfovibrio TaxID=2661612 RepID=UPI001F4FDD24|nr:MULTISPECIES: SpoIIE family protein phosphatase [unclassified Pseudodesulfovibrio]MCJ2165770.1 SpoIIE family protein phosphatase [Pseudodesulfovibrio sp. S3-i]